MPSCLNQAVVMIHGIGEQRPMQTLRGFVDSVLHTMTGHKVRYRNKPDGFDQLMETRCLRVAPNHPGPHTDFFEFYWAHHMRKSKVRHALGWLGSLLFRLPWAVPRSIRQTYFASWLLFAALAAIAVAAHRVADKLNWHFHVDGWSIGWKLVAVLIVALVIQWLFSYFLVRVVADAARYLTPSPDNIEERNKICSEGVALLRRLHESGKYGRIVVVGHSLGSVIAYDIVSNLWSDFRKPSPPAFGGQPELENFTETARLVRREDNSPAQEKVDIFQRKQHLLWKEFRKLGFPWLVTDLVTIGSPLAHAEILLGDKTKEFRDKKTEFVYPTCPPATREKIYYRKNYCAEAQSRQDRKRIRRLLIPRHGTPFCCVRWTNIYFPQHHLVMGDFVGGPLRKVFGKGIRDVPVEPHPGCHFGKTFGCHTRYWRSFQDLKETDAIVQLVQALHLEPIKARSTVAKDRHFLLKWLVTTRSARKAYARTLLLMPRSGRGHRAQPRMIWLIIAFPAQSAFGRSLPKRDGQPPG